MTTETLELETSETTLTDFGAARQAFAEAEAARAAAKDEADDIGDTLSCAERAEIGVDWLYKRGKLDAEAVDAAIRYVAELRQSADAAYKKCDEADKAYWRAFAALDDATGRRDAECEVIECGLKATRESNFLAVKRDGSRWRFCDRHTYGDITQAQREWEYMNPAYRRRMTEI